MHGLGRPAAQIDGQDLVPSLLSRVLKKWQCHTIMSISQSQNSLQAALFVARQARLGGGRPHMWTAETSAHPRPTLSQIFLASCSNQYFQAESIQKYPWP